MRPQLLIATSNAGKFREIGEIFESFSDSPFEILSLKDLALSADFEETGDTFEANALGKAQHYARLSGLLTLAEDSGILVDALAGELGVKTRRWGAGEAASDQEWIEYFLQKMGSVAADKRTARFVCCAALVDGAALAKTFRGETEGFITETLEAPIYGGLPLSSCFKPVGFDKVYSALELHQKNSISHRGKAIRAAYEWVLTYVAPIS